MKRIVHLGLGNFHRAHQAWYTANAGGWKITGVVMSNAPLKAQLSEHNNEYVLGTWGTEGLTTERISIYDDVLLASGESASVLAKIADPETHIVTLTITEKGYQLKSTDNRLDLSAQSISLDLASDQPKSAIGILAAGLVRRWQEAAQPLTVISCDNLSNNGRKLYQAIIDYITELEPEALPWIQNSVSFPNSMVDRITPRLSDIAVKEINEMAGVQGVPSVGTEAFSEWVVEDAFKAPRPDWGRVGAVLVSDVSSYEERKLRLLNAAHSYLAYAGLLAGHTFVHEAIADPELRSGVNALWDEAACTVSQPAASTLQSYRSALLDRFAVAQMRHSLDQIAMDGSVKLRERLVPILQSRHSAGLASPMTLQAITAWTEFIQTRVAHDEPLNDPNAGQLYSIVQENPSDASKHLIGMITQA